MYSRFAKICLGCIYADLTTVWSRITQPHLQWKLVWQTVDYTIRIHLFFFLLALGALLMHFPCFIVSYSLQGKENPFLIIFLHHTSPPLRSFPRHQQSHPENQFAQEAGLFNSRRGDWHLHHTPVALHFPLMHWSTEWSLLSLRTKNINCNLDLCFHMFLLLL